MSIDQNKLPETKGRIVACWHATKATYRTANAATHFALGALFKLLVVVYFLFCAVVLGLRYIVLPNIDSYKPDVERMASRALGNQVSIANINASWSGLRPQLSLDKVVIHDHSGKPALTLPHVSAIVSWWSVVRADLRLHQLEISRPDMDVLRDINGNLYVGGIFIDMGARGEDGTAADWVLSQREIVIRDGRLRWNDHQRAAPELMLENVDLVLQSRWIHHRFALKATPPAAFAAPLDIRAQFTHTPFAHSSDIGRWKGELYADLRDTDLTVWRAYVDYPIDMQRGKGSVRAWLEFDHARVADFTADLTLSDVSTRLRRDLDPLNLVEVSGRISVREDFERDTGDGMPTFGRNGHSIALTDFTLRTDDGLFLPRTTISESFVPAKVGKPAKTQINAKLLDLQTIANFAERLPFPSEQRRMLADFAPRGVLRDFSAEWHGAYPDISAYRVKGRFAGLSLRPLPARPAVPRQGKVPAQAAIPAIPGFDNLSGSVDASDRGGSFSIASDQLVLHLQGYSPKSEVPFEHLAMQASWAFQKQNRLLLEVQKMEFEHAGMAGSITGKHLMPLKQKLGASPGNIDVRGKLTRLDLQKIGDYLPVQTPDSLRQWLVGAVVGGTAEDVRFRLKGDLSRFPFRQQGGKDKGEFSVTAKIDKGVLNYAPGEFSKDGRAPRWPLIEEIDGTIAFNRERMEVLADSAQTSGTTLSRVKVVIPDLTQRDPLLTVDGEAAGPLQNFIRFTNDSPVAGWISHFTKETRASGNAKLGLKLHLPLHQMEEAKVAGSLQFSGNTVSLQNALPPLSGTNGKLEFNENGFSIPGIRSNFLGGPIAISGGTQRDGVILVKADGGVSADGIRKAYAMPAAPGAPQPIMGSTRYTASIQIKNGQPYIAVESSLTGITLDFPEPLRKTAASSLPFRLELEGLPSSEPGVARDEIRLSLGSAISAYYDREKIAGKDTDWRVVRGGIGVNVPAPQPDSGLIASVNMESLNIDAWRQAVSSIVSVDASSEAPKQQGGPSIAQYIEPEVLAARATELIVMDRKLDNVVVGASQQQNVWQANIDSRQASGYVTWVEPRSRRGLGKVTARLASLTIPKSAASEVTDLLEGSNETERMPALDISVERFELFGKQFGRLELDAQNARGATGWEWRIGKLRIANEDGELNATGKWARQDGGRVSSLDYTLNIADAGRLLGRFGFAGLLRGGKGRMEGDIRWKGVPFSIDIPSLSGQLRLSLADGQFLKVDQGAQGAAKLLGVLSLQSLPRRLALDFRDVFSEGFAFDNVVAETTIARGVANTDNFKMRSVAATVLIDGTADIAREEQDLHVVVIPEINAGAASVLYGLTVNPVIGVGTFLAQLFLRDPLMKAFTFEYLITGPWSEPTVTKLKHAAPTEGVANNVEKSG